MNHTGVRGGGNREGRHCDTVNMNHTGVSGGRTGRVDTVIQSI